MSALRSLVALLLLLGLAACDAGGPGVGDATGTWSGTAQFRVDTLMAGQNFRVVTDYETRYEFELTEDEDGLVIGFLNQYNTGTFKLREPRNAGSGPAIREATITWDDDLVQTWPVYGTAGGGVLELDLPEAEQAQVFPKDLWTFTMVGDRARLASTRIVHGYEFLVFENQDAAYIVRLSPSETSEFSIRRQ